ncbi:MAG: RdgB/HAM1 family non-canonical purine NTP pyrophosphatase [Clostridia bacterium]|nr:RdgB/HAM1 family non-canonical purine NTP pyrophosphatase [Clostridia bacterium]
MKLIIASNNAHKVREIEQIVGDYFTEMKTLREAGLEIDVVEDGTTFEENARKKAVEVLAAAPEFDAALADDSGLIVDALNGAPGVYSARYAGEGHDDAANNKKLLEDMDNVPEVLRTCRFASSIVLARRGMEPITVIGYAEGTLLREPRGENGFGYDPLFWYAPLNKTFAELTADEKNSVSHRSRSLALLKEALEAEKQ